MPLTDIAVRQASPADKVYTLSDSRWVCASRPAGANTGISATTGQASSIA